MVLLIHIVLPYSAPALIHGTGTSAVERNKSEDSPRFYALYYSASLLMLFSRNSWLFSGRRLSSQPLMLLLLLWSASSCGKAQSSTSGNDIANKSIDELMNIDVTSVSRKDQKLSKTPAAVYVITQQAIERSGANIIPDLLRMVPGVQVAQVEADRWAISVRGFNDIYSNKVLVLVDGRTVYTPSFSGVYWDQLDIPLDTIERIEIVRGPGGTVWGANAVNGVISIITKNSKDTKGTIVSAGAGSQETADFEARYGGTIGSGFAYRAFGHYDSFGSLPMADGLSGNDAWRMRHAGFRADWDKSAKDTFMMEGSFFQTNGGQSLFAAIDGAGAVPQKLTNIGGDILAQWTHRHSGTSDSTLRVYDNNYSRHDTGISEKLNVLDFDYQNRVLLGSKNDLVWGTGYRHTSDQIEAAPGGLNPLRTIGYSAGFLPPAKEYSLFSTFLQDEIRVSDDLSFTIGSKFEHNAFSGFEYEPSARLAWTPTGAQTVWLSASKAVRQPSRFDTGLSVDFPSVPLANGISANQHLSGNPGFKAEQLFDYEAGYRIAPSSRVLIDLAAYYSFYNNLESAQLTSPMFTPGPDGLLIKLPLTFLNVDKAQNYGSEAAITWNAASRWKLVGSYSWLKINVDKNSTSSTSAFQAFASNPIASMLPAASLQSVLQGLSGLAGGTTSTGDASPRQQFGIQSYFDVTPKVTFDNSLYFVDGLPAESVPAYTRLDSRLGWKLRKGIEASIVGQNLLSSHHLEFGDVEQAIATQVDRSVFGKIVWSF